MSENNLNIPNHVAIIPMATEDGLRKGLCLEIMGILKEVR